MFKFQPGLGLSLGGMCVFIILYIRPLVQSPAPNTPLVHLNLKNSGYTVQLQGTPPSLVIPATKEVEAGRLFEARVQGQVGKW